MRAPPSDNRSHGVLDDPSSAGPLAVLVVLSLVFTSHGDVCAQDPPLVKARKQPNASVGQLCCVGVVAVLGVAASLMFLNSRKRPPLDPTSICEQTPAVAGLHGATRHCKPVLQPAPARPGAVIAE